MFSRPWACSTCLFRSMQLSSARWLFRRLYATTPSQDSFLSPILLDRARTISREHFLLSAKLTETFDPRIAKRVGEIAAAANAVQEWNKATESISELNSLLEDTSTDTELRDLAAEDLLETTENLSNLSLKLKQSLIPKHPFQDLPCLIELHPGAGGDEAGIFAYELLEMYLSYCSRKGLKTNVLKIESDGSSGSEEKLLDAVIEVETPRSYSILRTEAGVHRVQRVPATESKGRTHTSAVSVMVLPGFPNSGESSIDIDDPNSDYYINSQEVHAEKMKAGGSGGQHVNKTESAIRLTHIPTGIVVSMQDSRSQHENRRKAWILLRAKVAEKRQQAREEEMVRLRRGIMGGVGKMDRGDKIRTYNFGQNRCTDHRSGLSLHNLDSVLDGGSGLEKIMKSVRSWLIDQDIEALVAEEQIKGKEQKGKSIGVKNKA